MSTTSPYSRRPQSGSARPILLLLLAVVIFAAGGVSTWWWLTQRTAPKTAQATASPEPNFGPLTPSTLAGSPETGPSAAAASPEAGPSPAASAQVASGPTGPRVPGPRKPPAKPPVSLAPVVTVAQLLGEAETASTANRFSDAADLYDRALALEPTNEKALAGKARIAAMGMGRAFVLGTTTVESLRAVGRDLEGFDTKGVGVKRAPKIEGQINLVMEPATVKPGEPYAVKLFLKNDAKKGIIEVDEIKVSMIVDGKWSTRPLPSKARQIAPKQRVLLEELPGIWHAGVSDWAVEAVVTSKNQDVYRNRLTWK
jgi:hypothetical protein